MEGEFSNFLKVWASIFICTYYSFSIGKIVSTGTTAFFISWLGSFKLLLFAYGKGPLAVGPSISWGRFVAIACFPIEIQQNQPPKSQHPRTETYQSLSNSNANGENRENPTPNPQSPLKPKQNGKNLYPNSSIEGSKSTINHVIKGLLLAIIIVVLTYKEHFHPKLITVVHSLYIYLLLEILLAIVGVLARALLGLDLKPHFNEPYLSTSLQDFWGRRWNLVATGILRPAVCNPIRNYSTRFIGRKWAQLPATWASFAVSGLVHELIYYFLGRVKPSWEVTCFFLLQGTCVIIEIVLKKALRDRYRLPRIVSMIVAIGFVVVTGFWLFFPQWLRCKADVRMLEEYAAFGAFLKNIV